MAILLTDKTQNSVICWSKTLLTPLELNFHIMISADVWYNTNTDNIVFNLNIAIIIYEPLLVFDISTRPIYRPIFCIFLNIGIIRYVFLLGQCVRDFYFDGTEKGSTWAYSSHSPFCSLSPLTVWSNTDRSLSNNPIEQLNKEIHVYKKYYNDWMK